MPSNDKIIVQNICSFGFGLIGALIATGLPPAIRDMMREPAIRLVVMIMLISLTLIRTNSFSLLSLAIMFLVYNMILLQTPTLFYVNIFLLFGLTAYTAYSSEGKLKKPLMILIFVTLVLGVYCDILQDMTIKGFTFLNYFLGEVRYT